MSVIEDSTIRHQNEYADTLNKWASMIPIGIGSGSQTIKNPNPETQYTSYLFFPVAD